MSRSVILIGLLTGCYEAKKSEHSAGLAFEWMRTNTSTEKNLDPFKWVSGGWDLEDKMPCQNASQVDSHELGSSDYYFYHDYFDGDGPLCKCSVTVSDTTEVYVRGITVLAPNAVYYGTEADLYTENDPELRPAAVAVEVPWLDVDSDGVADVVVDEEMENNDGPEHVDALPSWFAFEDQTDPDKYPDNGNYNSPYVMSEEAIDASGEYSIFVSLVMNRVEEGETETSQYRLGACGRLDGSYDPDYDSDYGEDGETADTGLSHTQDYTDGTPPMYFSIQTRSKIVADGEPEVVQYADGRSETFLICEPGATATTEFMLLDWDGTGYAHAAMIGGELQHTHSEIQSISVVDWNGATTISAGSPEGVVDLLAETDTGTSVQVAEATQWIGTTGWWSDSAAADGSGPIVSVTHTCPETFQESEDLVEPAYPVSWAELDSILNDLTGLELLDAWDDVTDSTLPAFLVRVSEDERNPNFTHQLQVESHGQRVILSIPMQENQDGSFDFHHVSHGLVLHGQAEILDNGLALSVSYATIMTPLGELTLDNAEAFFSGYPDLNDE